MKRFWRILDVIVTVLLSLVIVCATYLALSARRAPDSIPMVLGNKVLTVLSGSMEPAIHTGDIIMVRPLQAGEMLAEGDIATFRLDQNPRMLITHRVIGVLSVNGKVEKYITKGDANKEQDTLVAPAQVLGRYHWRVPYFGYVAEFIRRPLGTVLVVIVPGVILIALEIRRLWHVAAAIEAAKGNKT